MENFAEEMIENVINDPKTQEIIKENIQKSIAKSIEDSFRYGDLSNAISKRIKETLVPYIENYDLSAYTAKLETILLDIVNNTSLIDNKKIISNFKELMIEPESKTVTLEDIFKHYCDYMADNVDTTDLEVCTDDSPSYEMFECYCSVENSTPSWSSRERYDVHFDSEQDALGLDAKEFTITLQKWNFEDDYSIIFCKEPSVDQLRFMSDFEVYLLKLTRAGIRLTGDIHDLEDEVQPEAEPEATYS